MHENIKIKKHLSSFQIIIIGFAAVILLGSFILMMPFSAKKFEKIFFYITLRFFAILKISIKIGC